MDVLVHLGALKQMKVVTLDVQIEAFVPIIW